MEDNSSQTGGFWKRIAKKKRLLIIILGAAVILGAGSGVYVLKASDSPSFCTTCHIMESYYQSWQSSSYLANKHAAGDVTCHDCHESTLAIQAEEGIKFVTGDYKEPLDKRLFSNDFCLNCHSTSGIGSPKGATFEDAKTATNFEQSNPHDSHNGEQDCNTCHSMHQQSTLMCAQCHEFEWAEDLDDGWSTEAEQ